MTEYALYQGRIVEVIKRRRSPDGKTEASVQIRIDNETKVVLPGTLTPYQGAQPAPQPAEVQLSLFEPPVISAAMESFAAIANPAPVPNPKRLVYVDYIQEPGELVKLPTIGKMTARAILERRDARDGGKYGSFQAMVESNSDFKHIDWDIVKGLVSFEAPNADQ